VIVRSTIDLAHNLGLTVVAEGVEDKLAMQLLVAYGCDNVQGYHFGRPYPIEDLNIWLTRSPYGTRVAVGAA
jgi:EAL domain-containing protein (putative c-di-GMP-specific phosphodiesterase class I)